MTSSTVTAALLTLTVTSPAEAVAAAGLYLWRWLKNYHLFKMIEIYLVYLTTVAGAPNCSIDNVAKERNEFLQEGKTVARIEEANILNR